MSWSQSKQRFVDGDGPTLINAVGPDGKFTDEGPEYCRGRWVKDCDKDIIRDLKQRGLLYPPGTVPPRLPLLLAGRSRIRSFSTRGRAGSSARRSSRTRCSRTTRKINWLPEHIKDGRFGKFLESNVDWALSRERYWGTPLPIWVCEETGQMEAVASYDELLAKPGVTGTEVWDAAKKKNPELPDDLQVHKPYIDAVTYDSPFANGARMRRVTEVIDCWYDTGAMPFAQWGYRGDRRPAAGEAEREQFHIAIPRRLHQRSHRPNPRLVLQPTCDQHAVVWGGSYEERGARRRCSLLAPRSSSLPSPLPQLHRPRPHARRRRAEDVEEQAELPRAGRDLRPYGADALRWYFFANQPPWTSIRYNEQAIKDSIPEFLLRLWNVYSFFVIYANIDGFDPAAEGCRIAGCRGQGLNACAFLQLPSPTALSPSAASSIAGSSAS